MNNLEQSPVLTIHTKSFVFHDLRKAFIQYKNSHSEEFGFKYLIKKVLCSAFHRIYDDLVLDIHTEFVSKHVSFDSDAGSNYSSGAQKLY